MKNPLLHPDILVALGIDELNTEEQTAFLGEVGDKITEAALLRFFPIISEPQQIKLQEYLETDPGPETLIKFLLDEYEEFAEVLKAVVKEIGS